MVFEFDFFRVLLYLVSLLVFEFGIDWSCVSIGIFWCLSLVMLFFVLECVLFCCFWIRMFVLVSKLLPRGMRQGVLGRGPGKGNAKPNSKLNSKLRVRHPSSQSCLGPVVWGIMLQTTPKKSHDNPNTKNTRNCNRKPTNSQHQQNTKSKLQKTPPETLQEYQILVLLNPIRGCSKIL